uniref:Uncharacterized protein n=1 Tax=Romanomermis culicivorax TaxID=13658 RepID=A0A915L9W6_ROMCU
MKNRNLDCMSFLKFCPQFLGTNASGIMSSISSTRNDDQCSGFEPQNWRRDRCKKCFRLKEQHTRSRSGSENIGSKMKKLIPPSSGSKSLDFGQPPDSKIATSLAASSSWRQKFQAKSSSSGKCCEAENNQTSDEISVQKSKENGTTEKGEPEIPYTTKKIGGNAIAGFDHDKNSETPPPTLARKTRLVILKAEVSVDGNPVADEISVETSIGSDSPSARSPCAATASTTATIRQKSPDTQSFKSFDGSVASSSEYLSARSVPIGSRSRTSSSESVASTLMVKNDCDDVDRVSLTGSDLLQSEDEDDDERSLTPTTGGNGAILRRKLRSLRVKLKTLERKCSDLKKENERYKKASALVSPSAHPAQNLETLQTELVKSDALCENYQLENERLRNELFLTATPKASGGHSSMDMSSLQSNNNLENASLREKLSAAEQLCEEEEEIDEFRDLQRELEQTAKNCRILQFKLRKAERRNDQTEADRQHLQEKIREILNNNGAPLDAVVDSPRLRELESELRIAKEVSVRLHNELEAMDEKRCKLEDENFCFRERIRELEAREKIIDISRPKTEQQKKYNHDGTEIVGRLPPTSNSEVQLLRNLQDALERETDLRDQLKFAEHDIKMARKSVSDLETENECLMRQLSKISSTKSLSSAMTNDSSSSQQQSQNGGDDQTKKGGKNAGRPTMKRSLSEGHAQIELELAEQEAQVLRAKLEKMERDKENLVSKISLLEKEAGKLGGRTQFSDEELRTMVPDTYYKQKIRMLEEEVEEWKTKLETMQKAEADQDSLDRSKFQKPMSATTTLSSHAGSGTNVLKDADLKFKHDILERDVSVLRQRLVSLELENERISNDNRRLMTKKNIPIKKVEKVATNGGAEMGNAQEPLSLQDKVSKMEAEARRFLNRITDLEKEKDQLSKELERRKKLENIKRGRKNLSSGDNDDNLDEQKVTCLELQDKVKELMRENDTIKSDLKNAQQRAGNNETQLAEYKQIIGMSDDQKLITMATKVEVLTNQLKEVQARYETFHRSMTVDRDPSIPHSEKYEDILKHRIESLEKELSVQKANAKAPWRSDFRDYLCSQLEQLESTLRNSKLKQDTSPIAEKVKDIYDTVKSIDTENDPKSAGRVMRGSDSEIIIRQLKGQLDQSLLEKSNAIQECERATARLLQTEERWNKELEKLRESYENQMKDLKYYLEESEKIKEEKSCLLLEKTASLSEKTKRLNECESKIQRLEQDLKQKHKDLQDKLDAEKKRAKEFETKYQKLESLYETDRQKLNSEKEKFKTDLSEIKKRYEETQMDFEKLKVTYERKENGWASEKIEYEKRLSKLIDDAKEIEVKAAKKAQEMSSAENQKLLASLEELKQLMDSENKKWSEEMQDSKSRLEFTIKENETLSKDIVRLKKELETATSQIKDQKQQLEETRRVRDETKEEMQRWQQTWTKERAELAHKMRQEEKVQQAEQQALHLKYESKIKIIEDSNKRVQTQFSYRNMDT